MRRAELRAALAIAKEGGISGLIRLMTGASCGYTEIFSDEECPRGYVRTEIEFRESVTSLPRFNPRIVCPRSALSTSAGAWFVERVVTKFNRVAKTNKATCNPWSVEDAHRPS